MPGMLAAAGDIARLLGLPAAAGRWLRKAIALAPDAAAPLVTLGALRVEAGPALRALAIESESWIARYNLALVWRESAPARALEELRFAIARHPLVAPLRLLLLRLDTAPERKVGLARQALILAPGDADALAELAAGYLALGEGDQAAPIYGRAVAADPENFDLASTALLVLSYADGTSPGRLAMAHRAFGRRFPERPAPPRRIRPPADPIRVGMVSGDFRWHATAFFLPPLLLHRDRSRWQVRLYANVAAADGATERFRALADAWTDIHGVDDDAAERRIRADNIDVLIDLNGHTRGHRLGLFARRLAPVQATWMDYPGSTGLRQVDYAITDRHHSPPGTESDYVETILRLPHDRFCYETPAVAEPVGGPPAATNGYITFGCFNALYKIGSACVAAWSRILDAVPESRLRLLGAPAAEAIFRQRFARHGIAPERIEVMPPAPQPVVMARYGGIDLALDSFPYSGGLTTCEALWMGTPVVTFPGDRVAGRHSTAHLRTIGFDGLVAADVDAYVARAIDLSRDVAGLTALRREIRPRMAASPLVDGPGFARDFETLLASIA
jgi:protein O-GlcNAc transferase